MRADVKSWTGRALSGGRYDVAAKLGEGGMGLVYRARDNHLQTDVVIKVPRPDLQGVEDFAERFLREVRSLVRLAHPHVVRVLDVDEEDGVCFAVMQFLAGGSLYDRPGRAADRGALPMKSESLNGWIKHVAEALDFIHREGYVHRDVKPVNILFDAHGHVFLSDFGMAKALAAILPENHGANLTGAGTMIGTPGYVSPEQIMGLPVDGRADQYGLASTVYEMLVGRNPFSGVPASAILVHQATKGVRPAIEFCSSIPLAVSEAIGRAMSIDSNARFATCSDFARVVLQMPEVHYSNATTEISRESDQSFERPVPPVSPLPLRTVPIGPAELPPPASPGLGPIRTPTLVIPVIGNTPPGLGPAIPPLTDRPSDVHPPDANSDFLQIACPRCRRPLRLPRSAIGKKVQCPKCGASVEMSPHSRRSTPPPAKMRPGAGGSGTQTPPPLPPVAAARSGQRTAMSGLDAVPGNARQMNYWYLTAAGVIVGLALAFVLLGTNVLQTVTGASASRSNATDSKQTDH